LFAVADALCLLVSAACCAGLIQPELLADGQVGTSDLLQQQQQQMFCSKCAAADVQQQQAYSSTRTAADACAGRASSTAVTCRQQQGGTIYTALSTVWRRPAILCVELLCFCWRVLYASANF
jgi:hypothetical protein